VHVTYGCGSVLLWRRSDTLHISGFVDVIIFAHKLRLLEVSARLQWGSHTGLGLVRRNTRCKQRTDARDYFLQSGQLLGRSAHVEYLWHHVPAYISTRKWRVLKVTFHVAAAGAESVVYDCLVVHAKCLCLWFCQQAVDIKATCWSELSLSNLLHSYRTIVEYTLIWDYFIKAIIVRYYPLHFF